MKRKFSALVLTLVMVLTAVLQPIPAQAKEVSTDNYVVTLPDGYDENRAYPVVYVMPQNGYDADDSGITEKLADAMSNGVSTDMIIVKPIFEEGEDIHAAMDAVVAEIDATYSTIADAEHRAIVGTGTGGYLAYILGLTEAAAPVAAAEGDEAAPAAEDEAVPAEEDEAAPAEEDEVVPAEEDEAVPAEEDEAVPAEEDEAVPAAEDEVVPAEEDEVVPAEEDEVVPAEEDEVVPAAEDEATEPVVASEPVVAETPACTTLSAPKLFKYVASIRGDFASDNNEWLATYGDVYTYLTTMGASVLANFYTYIDAPVDDAWTYMEGSSNDIGALFITFGTPATAHEFTVRTGAFSDKFLGESVNRIAARMTSAMLAGMVVGKVNLTKSALTSDVKNAEVNYEVTVNDSVTKYVSGTVDMEIVISLVDPATNEVLESHTISEKLSGAKTYTGSQTVGNLVNDTNTNVQLSVDMLGATQNLASAKLVRVQDTVVNGDYQSMDLMGDWYVNYVGQTKIDVPNLKADDYKAWPIAQPGLDWWDKGFANINDETVTVPSWAGMFGLEFKMCILGSTYNAKEFELPEGFDQDEYYISVGQVDDYCEVFLNGTRIGGNGLDENGDPIEDTTAGWEDYVYFKVSKDLFVEGTNTIVVRAYNSGYGGGGWYNGPIGIYSESAMDDILESTKSRFIETSFESAYAASAQGVEGTVENEYLVYLPQSYDETDRYYPTVYLFHQINSNHRSYLTDDIDKIIDELVEDEMIVVVPNSSANSWWTGDWEKMVTEELVPLIDSTYRTIDDARYRLTAGCSMGGQGAYGIGLTNPDIFSGVISFFGALSMAPSESEDALLIAQNESEEYLDYYTWYFTSGNQDGYGFGKPAIQLSQTLTSKDIDHAFFIENGGHDSAYYVPYFADALNYARANMYKSDDIVGTLMSGAVAVDGAKLTVSFEALKGIEAYYNLIPDSSYTIDGTPDLSLPLIIEVEQGGKVVYSTVERDHVINEGNVTSTFEYDLTGYVDTSKDYNVTYKVAVFDKVVEIKNVKVVDGKVVENTTNDPGTTTPEASDKNNAVDTGDHAPIALYIGIAVVAFAAVIVALRMKRRA